MDRLREITERDRLSEVAAALERGEKVDYDRLRQLQAIDLAQAGRAALLDALEREDEADAEFERIVRGG